MESFQNWGPASTGSSPEREPAKSEDLLRRRIAVDTISSQSLVQEAVQAFLRTSSEVLPVVEGFYVRGVLWRDSLERALLDGVSEGVSVDSLVDRAPVVIPYWVSVEEAWDALCKGDRTSAVLVDEEGNYVGVVSAVSLLSKFSPVQKVPAIGGLATPLGVYLSAGGVNAGAGRWGLVLTGMILAVLYSLALAGGYGLASIGAWAMGLQGVKDGLEGVMVVSGVVIFLVLLRLSPLSGIHGAEHMVVHAIERGEVLVPAVIRRMPREHPRCGTNLLAAGIVFATLFILLFELWGHVGALVAFIATILVWRKVGWFLQHWFTTKPPTLSQVRDGVEAGMELIAKLHKAGHRRMDFWGSLVNSGLPWVLLGVLLMGGTMWMVVGWLGWGLRFSWGGIF